MNTTRNVSPAFLFALILTSCNMSGQSTPKPPPIENFPVIDVQNPKENFLGLDNITLKSKTDPTYMKSNLEIRQKWVGAALGEFAEVTKVNADGTFTLTITASKINSETYGFKPYYGSTNDLPVHLLQYGTNVSGLALVHGEVHRKAKTIKYNQVVYATKDLTYVEIVNTFPGFPEGYVFSLKLKTGFNMIYVQETAGKKGLVTTSHLYEPTQFTSFLNP